MAIDPNIPDGFETIIQQSESINVLRIAECIDSMMRLENVESSEFQNKIFRLFGDDWEKVCSHHPAFAIHNAKTELDNLIIMLSECTNAANQCYGELNDIVQKNETGNLYTKIDLKISKEFFTFVHLASSIIDVCRRVRKMKTQLSGTSNFSDMYKKFLDETFIDTFNFEFVKQMRNNLSHITLHRPHWHLSYELERGEVNSGYCFNSQSLYLKGSWSGSLKELLLTKGNIDCYVEMLVYFKSTNSFLQKLLAYDRENLTLEETHLIECLKMQIGFGKRQQLKLLITQVSRKVDFDPYNYLLHYFTKNELRVIKKLPQNSKAQVDLMINIGDKWNICDDDLRASLYKIFKIY